MGRKYDIKAMSVKPGKKGLEIIDSGRIKDTVKSKEKGSKDYR